LLKEELLVTFTRDCEVFTNMKPETIGMCEGPLSDEEFRKVLRTGKCKLKRQTFQPCQQSKSKYFKIRGERCITIHELASVLKVSHCSTLNIVDLLGNVKVYDMPAGSHDR